MHDNSLLLHESLVLERFPSPYSVRCTTKEPLQPDAPALHVIASVILTNLMGLDVTKKVTIPRTAQLGNAAVPQGQHGAWQAAQHSAQPHHTSAQPRDAQHHSQHHVLQQHQPQPSQNQQRHLLQPVASPPAHVIDLTQHANQPSLQPDMSTSQGNNTAWTLGSTAVPSQHKPSVRCSGSQQHMVPTSAQQHGMLPVPGAGEITEQCPAGDHASYVPNAVQTGIYGQGNMHFAAPHYPEMPQRVPVQSPQNMQQQSVQPMSERTRKLPLHAQQPNEHGNYHAAGSLASRDQDGAYDSFDLSKASARLHGSNASHSQFVDDTLLAVPSLPSARKLPECCLMQAHDVSLALFWCVQHMHVLQICSMFARCSQMQFECCRLQLFLIVTTTFVLQFLSLTAARRSCHQAVKDLSLRA